MQTQKVVIILMVIASLILAACTPANASTPTSMPTNSPTPPLNDTSWILSNLNGVSALAGSPVTLHFAGDKINGTDGCNRYSSTYTVSGTKFTVNKNIIHTMMACSETIMQQAAAYTLALTQTANYKIENQELLLLDANGKTLAIFTPQVSGLGGTTWIVTGYNNGNQAVVSVLAGSELSANFSADGKLSGSAGCNNYMASYETSDKNIKISSVGSTKKACGEPNGVMIQESQFLNALKTVATYRRDGNQLELRTAEGALAVTLAIQPVQPPQQATSILPALPNAEYSIEGTRTGKAQLKDGIFEEAIVPGSATKIKVQLGKEQTSGDLNGDGAEDAVVTLVVNPGGSGTFTYLVSVLNEKGTAKPGTPVLLGDRIIVQSIAIQADNVIVTLLTRKADEPMSAEPKIVITRNFKLQGDQLNEIK
jgi:heat shock protein HslJ